jgi:two-component system, NtrC family, sensor histidine kinase KinB
MNIKSKISLALTFLFGIILLLGGLSAFYLNRLSNDSQAILQDNYISLEYAGNMQRDLADLARQRDPDALADFDENLKKQEKNVTEIGEGEATNALRREFDRFRRGATDSTTTRRIQEALFRLDEINRQAIIRKNEVAKQTAKDALLWLAVVGTLCFLIVLSFTVNFPGYIANPIRELTRGIKQVTSRNFEERLTFRSSDEFGELARSFNRMAEKLDEYEHSNLARILFEKKRIDTLIQVMSDGIIGLDQNRYILFINPVASRLLGLKEADLLGKYAPDVALTNDLMRTLMQESNAPASEPTILKIYDNEGSSSGKENYYTRQVQTVDIVRTGDEQRVRAGYVIVLKNITPFKELDLAKTNFIATVSHELKTPIASIKMSLKLLDDARVGTLNDEQRDLIAHVRDDADRLLNITGELLNMAQIESGQIQLDSQAVAPTEIVNYAVNALSVAANERNIRLKTSLSTDLPAIKADPDKTSWVLVNFLSNAVRHSPDDGTIDVSATQHNGHIEFRVRDHGAGIRPEHRDRVFDRYFRAPAVPRLGNNGQASGTGLGLAISKEFIMAMNGQIGLDTSVTDGAAFWFRLPVG